MAIFIPILLVGAVVGGAVALFKSGATKAPPKPTRTPKAPKVPTAPKPTPRKPSSQSEPFELVANGDGTMTLDIKSMFDTYAWAAAKGAENLSKTPGVVIQRFSQDTNASNALRGLLTSLPGVTGCTGNLEGCNVVAVRFSELPGPDEETDHLIASAVMYTWGQLLELAENFLQEKGLG